jgi:hypothetical protein
LPISDVKAADDRSWMARSSATTLYTAHRADKQAWTTSQYSASLATVRHITCACSCRLTRQRSRHGTMLSPPPGWGMTVDCHTTGQLGRHCLQSHYANQSPRLHRSDDSHLKSLPSLGSDMPVPDLPPDRSRQGRA